MIVEQILKEKQINTCYKVVLSQVCNNGRTEYKVSLIYKGQPHGGLVTNTKSTANNRYYYYCRKYKDVVVNDFENRRN